MQIDPCTENSKGCKAFYARRYSNSKSLIFVQVTQLEFPEVKLLRILPNECLACHAIFRGRGH